MRRLQSNDGIFSVVVAVVVVVVVAANYLLYRRSFCYFHSFTSDTLYHALMTVDDSQLWNHSLDVTNWYIFIPLFYH